MTIGDGYTDIVLIVDDNASNLEVVAGYLQTHGFQTAIASDGRIAVKRARHLRPDLILLDILMPGMDGIETCRQLKNAEETRDIPVIFMTALTDSEYKTRGFAAGGVDYVTKPIQHEELLARVKTHLEIQRYRKDLEAAVKKRTIELETRTTELETANRQLIQLQKTFLTVLDSIDATIYVADMQTHEILFMNRYMVKLFGADFTGSTCWKVFQGADGPCEFCYNDNLIGPEGGHRDGFSWEHKNPITQKWFMNSDRAIKWIDNRTVHIQVAMDITKIKELEKERLKSEMLLGQAQKMEAIGTLAGGIAHDFNNMLAPIIGYVELVMQEMAADQRTRKHLGKVLSAANRAKDLVLQILNFSRQSDHEPQPLRVQLIVREVLQLIKATLPTTIEIHSQIDALCPPVLADPAKVHQIVMNLVTNAFHAMEEAGGTLSIVLKEVALIGNEAELFQIPPGNYVRLQVSDTGIGMEKRTAEKIFDPYFTTKKRGKGTGLGLAVAQGIVRKYGGAIKVDSAFGKGASFSVYLPAIQESVPEETGSNEMSPRVGGNERILMVDDEALIVGSQKRVLENLGYRVTARTSSVRTLELFRKDPYRFDLLITDMTMPKMTGDQLARAVMEIRPDMPIIISTGYSERMDDEKCSAIGAKALIMKPFLGKELAGLVRRVLDSAATGSRS